MVDGVGEEVNGDHDHVNIGEDPMEIRARNEVVG